MPIAGHLTTAQLRDYVNTHEKNKTRRERLFLGINEPRAALINQLREEIFLFVINEQDALRKSKVLDYGCGVQPYRLAFEAVEAEIVGVDIGRNLDAQVQISDENHLPFSENTFEYIVSFQVLEHIPNPSEYLSECYRLLKPGGKIFLTTHGIWPFHPTPGDYHRWTKQGLILDFTRLGFIVESTGSILNESSAYIQSFIINFHYQKKFRGIRKIYHGLSNLLIKVSERYWGNKETHIPAIISITCKK